MKQPAIVSLHTLTTMNALAFAEPADACRQEDHSRSALDFIHQLLSATGDEKRR